MSTKNIINTLHRETVQKYTNGAYIYMVSQKIYIVSWHPPTPHGVGFRTLLMRFSIAQSVSRYRTNKSILCVQGLIVSSTIRGRHSPPREPLFPLAESRVVVTPLYCFFRICVSPCSQECGDFVLVFGLPAHAASGSSEILLHTKLRRCFWDPALRRTGEMQNTDLAVRCVRQFVLSARTALV